MADEFTIFKERVEKLRSLHRKALASYHIFETLQEFRAPNLIGKELAHKHAQSLGAYKGFFNIVVNALNTEMHIAVAKLFDSHKDALHIEKLVNYAEQNQKQLTAAQTAQLDSNNGYSKELAKVYEGLKREDLLSIKSDLEAAKDKIERLKVIRDKQVAHTDIKEKEDLTYLTYEEFADLIQLSEKILNLVSVRLYGNTAWNEIYKNQVLDDTKALLDLVDKSTRR